MDEPASSPLQISHSNGPVISKASEDRVENKQNFSLICTSILEEFNQKKFEAA